MDRETHSIKNPPRGWRCVLFLGPGLVWAASSIGVAELVFATRAGAMFGLLLLWAPVVSLVLKFFITELIGRYTVVTGENVVTAFSRLGLKCGPFWLPPGWIVWLFWILFFTNVAGMAGISLVIGSSLNGLVSAVPYTRWAVLSLITVGVILGLGSYRGLEWMSRILVVLMVFFTGYAVYRASPSVGDITGGLLPRAPIRSLRELIPLLGWSGAGAIGTVWFSIWTQENGRGRAGSGPVEGKNDTDRLRAWIRISRMDLIINTVITALLTSGFLIAGAEILHPLGLVPKGEGMGTALARIAGTFFGHRGEMIFLIGVTGTMFSTLSAGIDSLCRVALNSLMFHTKKTGSEKPYYLQFLAVFIVSAGIFATVVPAPVALLQLTAVIDTALLPVVAFLAIHICRRRMDPRFRPGRIFTGVTAFAGVFFIGFFVLLVLSALCGVKFGL